LMGWKFDDVFLDLIFFGGRLFLDFRWGGFCLAAFSVVGGLKGDGVRFG